MESKKISTRHGEEEGFFLLFACVLSFASVSPEPDDSMRDAEGRAEGCEAHVQGRSMVMRQQTMKKPFI